MVIQVKIVKHASVENPYGLGGCFCENPVGEINNPPSKHTGNDGNNEYCENLCAALKRYRSEHASRLLHEIAHSIFSSDNPEQTARMFFCAGQMYTLLKNITGKNEICTMSDIQELLRIIDGKEVD